VAVEVVVDMEATLEQTVAQAALALSLLKYLTMWRLHSQVVSPKHRQHLAGSVFIL
jgi:hypothetical protein